MQTFTKTRVDSCTQTDEAPLAIVLRDAINDTLLPGVAMLLDARLAPAPPGEASNLGPDQTDNNLDARLAPAPPGEAEQDEDESAVQAALVWLANLGPDLNDSDNDWTTMMMMIATHSGGYGAGCFSDLLDTRAVGLSDCDGNFVRKSVIDGSNLVRFQRAKVCQHRHCNENLFQ
jgi:hypothetical protein